MAQSRKLIKQRIKSVKNTRKITKAMELVAASKMRRAVSLALKARPYASLVSGVLASLTQGAGETEHPLLTKNMTATKHLLVVFSSDRGLAGGYNVNMLKKTLFTVDQLGRENVEVITIGKRIFDALTRRGINVIGSFTNLGTVPQYAHILPVARQARDAYVRGEYKTVTLLYTDYISGVSQVPTALLVLPLEREVGMVGQQDSRMASDKLFEPSPKLVLDSMLPRLLETLFYRALLESVASEHAARMVAMKNASDAASDMLTSLTFTYNQARQAAITQEIAEISSGAMALA